MPRRRLQALVLTLGVLVVPLLAVSAASTQAQPAPVAQVDATNAHPYSDPLYFPVRQPVRMDCFLKNPGCDTHSEYQLTLLTTNDHVDGDRVYAMGAGRIDDMEVGDPCNESNTSTNFGTQMEIYHGGGVTTRYGHFDSFAPGLKEGDLVDAGQWIGVMGNTGARGGQGGCAAAKPYLDFWVKDGKDQIDFKTLLACVNNPVPQVWPTAQYSEYADWNAVDRKKDFPALTTPADVPDGSCLTAGEPATPATPSTPSLDRAGSEKVVASWTGQPAGTSALAELQVYRVSTKSWMTEEYRKVPAGVSTTTFSDNLIDGGEARVRVSYHNAVGWSEATDWATRTVGAAPGKPVSRGVSSDTKGKKAFIRFSWKPGERYGFEPTGWSVEIRKGKGSWKAKKVSVKTFTYRFDDLAQKTDYQVRVKAFSGAGDSSYLTKSIRTAKK